MTLKLPTLTNKQYAEVEKAAGSDPIDHCPTCKAKPKEIAPDVWVFDNGTYRLGGEEHACDCQTQMTLRKHYLLANIGDQYQRLDWEDYRGSAKIRQQVDDYVERWSDYQTNGMGLEFNGKNLGVGKTFCATHVGKELVKKGVDVYFIQFVDIMNIYELADHEAMEEKLRTVSLLILDDVIAPYYEAQKGLFSMRLEGLIRHRTNFNRPIIITTNLAPDDLRKAYPRPYSLLEAKTIRLTLSGEDARQTFIAEINAGMTMAGEKMPIT